MRSAAAILVLSCVAASAASAQSVHDSLGWHFTGNLGYVQTSGNTKLSTINLGNKLTFRPNHTWLFTETAAFIYGYNDSTETANQALANVRGDYFLTPRLSLFGLGGYERNPFAGLDRRTEESVGLSWFAVKQPKDEFQVDIGAGLNQQTNLGVQTSFSVARLAPRFKHNFTGKSSIEESVELQENLDDTGDLRSSSLTQLVAPITSGIAIRFGYLMKYDAEPVPGFKKLDTTFTSGLQITF
jgi:putative salt-induced outer membrane protein YdiY